MITYISEEAAYVLDNWFKKFQMKNGNFTEVNGYILKQLAAELCDDCPLGYEASHRLANWLYSYFNKKEQEINSEVVLLQKLKIKNSLKTLEEKLDEVTDEFVKSLIEE